MQKHHTNTPLPPSFDNIKTYTNSTNSAVNETLQELAKNNKVIQSSCDVIAKTNDLALIFAQNDDIQSAIVLANMARSVAEGALKVGSSIVKNPVEYTKNFFKGLASGPLDIGSFLIQEDIKLQKLESSFESLDPKKMDNAALMYYKEHQGQVKAFAEAMKKIKSMSLNEVCKKSGELGMDLLAGSFYFKGLALLAKGADVANAAFKKTDELFMAMKNEKVIAGGSNVLGSSEEFIKSVSVTTKVAMEEGAEVGETIGNAFEGENLKPEINKPINPVVQDAFDKSQILYHLESLDENKIKHIIEGSANSNHKWEKLVSDKNWNDIKKIIKEVLETGSDDSYKRIKSKIKNIKGEIVEVAYIEKDGIIKISNAWVR